MVTSPCQVPGTRLSGCGTCPPARPPAGSRTTPRTCCPWPSQLTTGRSCLLPGTRLSSSGTPWPMQVHHPGRGPPGLGVLRQVLSQQCQPHHRLCRVGQVREGVEPYQLQVEDQPHWSHWISEHCHHVS